MDHRHISDNAENLALFIVTTGALYREHSQPTAAKIADAFWNGLYTPAFERQMWLEVADVGAQAYRKEIKNGSFDLCDRQQAALYLAEHYRDELRDVHKISLPTLAAGG